MIEEDTDNLGESGKKADYKTERKSLLIRILALLGFTLPLILTVYFYMAEQAYLNGYMITLGFRNVVIDPPFHQMLYSGFVRHLAPILTFGLSLILWTMKIFVYLFTACLVSVLALIFCKILMHCRVFKIREVLWDIKKNLYSDVLKRLLSKLGKVFFGFIAILELTVKLFIGILLILGGDCFSKKISPHYIYIPYLFFMLMISLVLALAKLNENPGKLKAQAELEWIAKEHFEGKYSSAIKLAPHLLSAQTDLDKHYYLAQCDAMQCIIITPRDFTEDQQIKTLDYRLVSVTDIISIPARPTQKENDK